MCLPGLDILSKKYDSIDLNKILLRSKAKFILMPIL